MSLNFSAFRIFERDRGGDDDDEDDEEKKKKWERPPSSYGSMKSDSEELDEEEEEEEGIKEYVVPVALPASSAHDGSRCCSMV